MGWELADKGPSAASELPKLVKELPEAFSNEGVGFLTEILQDARMVPEATALLQFYAKEHPRSDRVQLGLARTLIQAGDRRQVRTCLEKARRAKEDQVQPSAGDEAGLLGQADAHRGLLRGDQRSLCDKRRHAALAVTRPLFTTRKS